MRRVWIVLFLSMVSFGTAKDRPILNTIFNQANADLTKACAYWLEGASTGSASFATATVGAEFNSGNLGGCATFRHRIVSPQKVLPSGTYPFAIKLAVLQGPIDDPKKVSGSVYLMGMGRADDESVHFFQRLVIQDLSRYNGPGWYRLMAVYHDNTFKPHLAQADLEWGDKLHLIKGAYYVGPAGTGNGWVITVDGKPVIDQREEESAGNDARTSPFLEFGGCEASPGWIINYQGLHFGAP